MAEHIMSKTLNRGLSGCLLQLAGDNTIKKISPTINYNDRLSRQIKKQQEFYYFDMQNIRTPVVKKINHIGSLLFFEMEFINGISFDNFCITADKQKLDSFYQSMSQYFHLITKEDSYTSHQAKEIIIDKINSLRPLSSYSYLLDNLTTRVYKVNDTLPKTFCHGDLSCLNIIIKSHNIYFIDFLDSFIDTPLIDLIKLKQDLKHYWFLCGMENEYDALRIKQCCQYLWLKFENDFSHLLRSPYASILEILNFLRIEPYLKDQFKKKFLKCIIESL